MTFWRLSRVPPIGVDSLEIYKIVLAEYNFVVSG